MEWLAVITTTPVMDAEGERALCQRFAPRIRAYGLCHLRDLAAAEDLVQDVLLSVLQALRNGRVADPDRLDAYVLGTCRNSVMDIRRGTERHRRVANDADALPQSYEPAWHSLDRKRLEHCLEALEARERAVVLATFVDDRDAAEIGTQMGLSPGN